MHFDWKSQTVTRKTRPLPPTLAAQCHQLYMCQKLKKLHPTPLPIMDHSLYLFKTRFVTWWPIVFITPSRTYLESHSFCQEMISIKPIQEHFCQFVEDYRSKSLNFPNFSLTIEIKKYPFFAPHSFTPLPHLKLLQPSVKGR